MNKIFKNICSVHKKAILCHYFSNSGTVYSSHSCKLLVIGGGSGGCTIASKFARKLPKHSVIILEPSKVHYYQPLWTLVAAGVTPVSTSRREAISVLPSNAKWLQDSAATINPDQNCVTTANGDIVNYEFLVVAVGLINDYEKIPGLSKALQDENSSVSTIYDATYCEKTWRDLQKFKEGDALFTFPETPIKCPGAPQKIVYLADAYFRKKNIRSRSNLSYNTFLPVIFGVKKYADALQKVIEKRKINVNYKTYLKEVRPSQKEAVFCRIQDDTTTEVTQHYDMLHVTPPMKTPDFLSCNDTIVDKAGFLDVDKFTLRHVKYKNIYGIGDCTNTPNSKTAAAIAKQGYVVEQNLLSTMKNDQLYEKYNGYGACPLVTSYNTCILAEFLYDGVPRETLPFNQARESVLAYHMKRHLFPFLYWNFMLKGRYNGPEWVRKIINPFAK